MDQKKARNTAGMKRCRWSVEEIKVLLSEVRKKPENFFGPKSTAQDKLDAWAGISKKVKRVGAAHRRERSPSRCERKYFDFRLRTRQKLNKIAASESSKGLSDIELEAMEVFEEVDNKLDRVYNGTYTVNRALSLVLSDDLPNQMTEPQSVGEQAIRLLRKGRRRQYRPGNPEGDGESLGKFEKKPWQCRNKKRAKKARKRQTERSKSTTSEQHAVVVLYEEDPQRNKTIGLSDSSVDCSNTLENEDSNSSVESSTENYLNSNHMAQVERVGKATHTGLETIQRKKRVVPTTPMGILPKATRKPRARSFVEDDEIHLQNLSDSYPEVNESMDSEHSDAEADIVEESGHISKSRNVEDKILSTLEELLLIQRERLKIEKEKLKLKRMKIEILKSSG